MWGFASHSPRATKPAAWAASTRAAGVRRFARAPQATDEDSEIVDVHVLVRIQIAVAAAGSPGFTDAGVASLKHPEIMLIHIIVVVKVAGYSRTCEEMKDPVAAVGFGD